MFVWMLPLSILNLMGNYLGKQWKVGLPECEKGTLGKRKMKGHLPGDRRGDGRDYGPGRYSQP